MPVLFFLLFPVAEIYVFVKFVEMYSFLDAFLTLVFSFLLGAFVMKTQGKAVTSDFQVALSQGKLPSTQILHRVVVIIGGLLLMIPGFISDALGILCIMPGTRHLIVFYIKFMFAKGLIKASGNFNFSFGNRSGGFAYRRSPSGTDPQEDRFRQAREATVIDITPLEVTHTKKED